MRAPVLRLPFASHEWLCLALLLAAAAEAPLRGQDQADPIQFRRLYVPQDELDSGPRDPGVRYAPMRKADFERLVDLLRTTPPDATATLAARLNQAAYRARLTSSNDLSGQAILDIERRQARAARAKNDEDPGALLPLSPCGLAVSHLHWPDDPPEEAVCGLDAQGQLSVLTRRSGSLVFDWTLRGQRERGGGWRYNFELPATPSSSLSLDLPANLSLTASRGVVVQAVAAHGVERRWELELGGQNRFWILLVSQEEARRQDHGAMVRQSHVYNLSPRGLELTAQLTIDAPQEPLRQLELSIDPALRLLAARQGETHVPWSVVQDPARPGRILLEFPEPLHGLGNILLLGATAPITLDEPWRLPGIRAHGIFWQEGRATLLVPKPWALERLNLSDCRQSGVGALQPPEVGESIALQYFVPEAGIEVLLAHGQQRLQASTGTAIELTEDSIQGRVVAELSVNEGQLFSLQAAVPHRWNIDTVESEPPQRVRDWSLDTPTPRKRVLDVRLAKALSPGAPLRLVISGHRVNVAAGESLPAEDLRMIDFAGAAGGEHAMSVVCPQTYQLRSSGAEELTRYDPQKLDVAIASLLGSPSPGEGLLFRLDPKAARLTLAMERLAPRYSAEIRMTATATPGPLWEAYEIQCRPQGSRVEHVAVYFSHTREEAPRWRLRGEAEDQISARRLSDEEMLARCGRETGEMWELTLRTPRSGPLEIQARRASPLGPDTPLSLIWLPGAESQEAHLQIRCGAEAAVHVHNSRLRPVPLEGGQTDSLLRGRYRYLPSQDTAAADPPPISLSRDGQALSQSAAVVWQAVLESRYAPTGGAHHTATWFLENLSQASFTLALPASGIELDDVWVDDERVVARTAGDRLSIPLPANHRYPSVMLNFRTREPTLGELRRLAAPFPAATLPVLSSEWTLWLPPGYSLAQRGGTWQLANHSPLTLAQRLLGPLARTGRPRFDPFRAEDWRRLAGLPWEDQEARRTAHQFLEQLGRLPAGTWAQMLWQLQPALESAQQTLLVDRHALWKAGVSPEGSPASFAAESDRARGLARLEAARLSLLVRGDVLLLTTPLAAASLADQLAPLDHAALGSVAYGNFAQTLEQAALQQGTPRFCLANQWVSEPLPPWQSGRTPAGERVDTPGWGVYRLAGPSSVLPQVEIVRQSTIDVFAWGLFLLIVAACFRRLERPTLLVAMASVCGVAALLMPELYAPICSSAFLGFLTALVWQATVRTDRSAVRSEPSSHSFKLSDSVHTVATGALLLVVCLVAACAWADEELAEPAAPPPTVHKVLIPVDDTQQPVGDLYWVPESMYTQMERRAARLALEPQGWLLERADYRGGLTWDVAQQRLLVSDLRMRLDLYVFEPSRRVRLPLGREGHALVPSDRFLIDGVEVAAQWEDEGRLLCFDLAQPGLYRLELTLRPTVSSFGSLSGFDLAIPPLPTARLELQLPRSSPAVEVTSALGAVALQDEDGRLVAQLGRASRLKVQWADGAAASTLRTTVDADQLVWLKVQPGSVIAEARWKFKVLEGSLREVQLALDPRLQLQAPLEVKNPLVAQARVLAGNPQIVQIELARPVTDQFTLDASLRWSGASGIGNLRVPLVEAQQVRSLRRLLAVSLDPLIDHQETAAEGLTAVPPADFLQQWGAADAPPALAYRHSGDTSPWFLSIRSKPVRRSVESVLAVSLSGGRAAWRYDAAVQIGGSCFEHRLLAPPALRVESVEVREEGVPRLSRWSRDSDGSLTLFLTEAASGPQQIVVQGWTPLPQRGTWRLIGVRLDDAEQRSAQVRVYRQPSLRVEVRNRNALAEHSELRRQLESQLFESDRRYVAMGRLVSLMQAEAPAYSATLMLSPNQPRFACRQVTTLKRESGVWQAELDCHIDVLAGLVDALRFEVPAAWQAPVVTPAADYSLVDAGDGKRQLIVRPVAALTGQSRLRIRGNLPPGARPELPSIIVLGAERLERQLVVPGQIDLQNVSWDTRGLSRVEPPSDWTGSPGLAAPEAYQVVDDAFSATLQSAPRTPGQPQVSLADISVAWGEGTVQGVAAFDLEPAGNQECPLVLPEGYQLVQVLVGGLPALAAVEGPQRWRLALGAEELPQRVEVVFSGQLPKSPWGRQRLLAPSLGDAPVDRTLWTIRGPKGSQPADALLARRVSPWRQDFFRLQSIAGLMRLVQDLPLDETSADLAAWHTPWQRRFQQCRDAVEREVLLARESDAAAAVLTEVRSLSQEQARFVREVLGESPAARPVALQTVAEQPGQLWRASVETPQPPLRLMLPHAATEIELVRGASAAGDLPLRLLAAVGLAGAAALVLALVRSRWWPAVHRWRYAAAAALGVAWWLWLAPSILGWLIVALAIAAAFRERAPAQRETGSTVVRLGTRVG